MNLAGTAFDGQGNADLTYTPGDTCTAASGFDDIAPGTEVDILDPAGKVVGVGQLDDGAIGPDKYTCEFAFKVLAVPTSETLYGIKIGNQARGVVHFSKAQLFAGPELTLSGDL